MRQEAVCLKMAVAVGAMFLCTTAAHAASGAWNGAVDTLWANDANWSAAPYPSGSDTASFTNAGNDNTVIDLTGLSNIKTITFSNAGAAPYVLGSGGPKSQTLVLNNAGLLQLASTLWQDQSVDANIQLGTDKAAAFYALRNDAPYRTLTVAGDVAGAASGGTAGTKTLSTLGTGDIVISGSLSKGGATALNVTNALTAGVLTLSGSNTVKTFYMTGNANNTVTLSAGELFLDNLGSTTLYSTQGGVINGPGKLRISTNTGSNYGDNYIASGKTLVINASITGVGGFEMWSGTGTFVFNGINDFAQDVIIGPAGTISVSKIGNQGSATSNLGKGVNISLNASGSRLLYTGAGETSDRILNIKSAVIVEHAGTGHLNFSTNVVVTSGDKTLTLRVSPTGTAEFSGLLRNDQGNLSVTKDGAGTWTLSAANTLSGNTLVSAGTLRLAGAGGLAASTNYTLSAGGTLLIENTASANSGNRLKDTATVTLRGGTLDFSHNDGSASYAEAVGALVADQDASTVATAQASEGQTSSLTFASLGRNGAAAVNFAGAGLGASARNRIFITGQPNGVIGPWATVNGTDLAAYDSALGVIPAGGSGQYADISALGPSVITNNPGASVRINTVGESGPITLSDTTTMIATLLQNTATDATVDTAGQTLQTDNIVLPATKAAVTVGVSANDGTLSPATAGGTLLLANESASALTVNARLADNGAASSLIAYGSGPIVLTGSNTFSGSVSVAGSLTLANALALQNATLLSDGAVFDESVASHAFTLGNLSGAPNLALEDNAAPPNAVALTVGGNNASTAHSGTLSGGGSLTKAGSGTLTLSRANTHSGGTSVLDGQLTASQNQALGLGPVVNDAVLDLSVGNTTYSGLSTSLAGAGTVNVNLGTGSNTSYFDGDYSGFTGVWNLGRGTGGGKARMNGPDNPAATIHARTNATAWVNNASTHDAALVLHGGNCGESYGQLRLENNATWAGPVYLFGDITDANDGFFGGSSTTGFISGVISDLNGAHPVQKVGSSTRTYLTCPTNTFGGTVWVRAGSLGAASIRNVGETSSLGQPADATAGTIKIGTGGTAARLTYLGTGDTTDRVIDMAGTTATAYLEQAGEGLITFTSDLAISGTGNKTLYFEGATSGSGEFAGVINNGSGSTISVSKSGTGTWTLSGANSQSGLTTVNSGKLIAKHPSALGTGTLSFPTSASLELAYNSDGETPYVVGMNSGATVTLLMGGDTETGVRHTLGAFSIGSVTVNAQAAEGVTAGTPALTIPSINLSAGGSGTAALAPLDAELHIGSVAILANSAAKTLQLDGTNAASTVTGSISNGINTLSLLKANASTWTLFGPNPYSGATTVAGGTLRLAGADGAITASSGITIVTNGTLALSNTLAENNPDRLGNAIPLTLAGATLSFDHPSDAADYTETAGALSISVATNTIATSQAGEGQTSALTFASLIALGGALDFTGTDLGVDARNQVRFTAEPALYGGIIGPWATVNGTHFATYATYGVTAFTPTYTNLAARGGVPNATVPDDANAHALITDDGDTGAIALEGAPTSSIATLTQANTNYPATVGTASKTFRTLGLTLADDAEAFTIGSAAEDGTLTALSDGGILTLKNNSANTLTVNAAIADNTSASTLTILGSGPVTLNGAVSHTGPTALSSGTLTFASAQPQTLSGAISGDGTLVKNGTNILHLMAANTYTGPTLINEGVVQANDNNTFGSAAGGVFLADGVTLELGCTPDVGGTRPIQGLNQGNRVFTVRGAGVNGLGAIVNTSTGSQYNAISKVELAGNTTFGGTGAGRWDIRNNLATLNMNGHTISKAGNNTVGFTSATVNPGGGHIDVQTGILRFESSTKLNGSAANTLTVRNGGELELYKMVTPIVWSLLLENGAIFDAANNSDTTSTTQNRWDGPVTVGGALTLTGSSTGGKPYIAALRGEISGAGPITKTGAADITLSGTNTFTGQLRVTGGIITAPAIGNIGEAGPLGQQADAADAAIKLSGGALAYTGPGETPDRSIELYSTGSGTVINNATGPLTLTNNLWVTASGNKTLTLRGASQDGEFSGSIANGTGSAISVLKSDTGSWLLSGDNAFTGYLYVNQGTLRFSGSNAQGGGALIVGNVANSNALMRIQPGALITGTGDLRVGSAGNSAAGLYITGGEVYRNPGTAGDNNIGVGVATSGSYGYLNISDGTVTNRRLNVGGTATVPCSGIVRMTGGLLRLTEYILLARTNGCVAVLTADGGTIDRTSASANISIAHSGGRGELNLTGGTLNNVGRNIAVRQNNRGTGSTGVVNVCAGTLILNVFQNEAALGRFWLNFNGGTVRAATSSTAFMPNTLTRVTVNGPFGTYAGGAVIDTDGKNVTVAAPLEAPAGNGVSSIALATQGSGYVGEPYVAIDGGGGEGATAVANMEDDGTGNGTYRVASVTITTPGCGYTSVPAVTFYKGGHANSGTVAATAAGVTLAPNTSGGLTKQGNGTLTLTGASTYTGMTTISGGTLKLGAADALPPNAPVTLDGGTYDLGGFNVTNEVTFLSGSVANGTLNTVLSPAGEGVVGTQAVTLGTGANLQGAYVADADADGSSDLVAVTGTINLSGLTLQIVDPNGLNRHQQYTIMTVSGTRSGAFASTNLPDAKWKPVYLSDGTVKLVFVDGTLIKVR